MERHCLSGEFAQNVKMWRKSLSMSQHDLGVLVGYSQHHVSLWETGKSCPGIKSLLKLSTVFRTTVDHLLFYPNTLRCGTPECLFYDRVRKVVHKLTDNERFRGHRLLTRIFDTLTTGEQFERDIKFQMLEAFLDQMARIEATGKNRTTEVVDIGKYRQGQG